AERALYWREVSVVDRCAPVNGGEADVSAFVESGVSHYDCVGHCRLELAIIAPPGKPWGLSAILVTADIGT
ncbi:MAG: hypothetical protein WB760_08180, partial [Xanthobacteraceae bacterium]